VYEYRGLYCTDYNDEPAEKWEKTVLEKGAIAVAKGVQNGCVAARLEQIHLEREE